jgi:hypothetical protein
MPSHQAVAGMQAIDPDYVKQPSPMASTAEPNRNTKYDPKKPHIVRNVYVRTACETNTDCVHADGLPHYKSRLV